MSNPKSRADMVHSLVMSGIIRPEDVEKFTSDERAEPRKPSASALVQMLNDLHAQETAVLRNQMIFGESKIMTSWDMSAEPGKILFSKLSPPESFPGLDALLDDANDVEDVDLAERCDQLEAELADAREALQIERDEATKWAGHAGKYAADLRKTEARLTAQNHAVECAMRYVKVQSARYQRELLAAIDELERCPK